MGWPSAVLVEGWVGLRQSWGRGGLAEGGGGAECKGMEGSHCPNHMGLSLSSPSTSMLRLLSMGMF